MLKLPKKPSCNVVDMLESPKTVHQIRSMWEHKKIVPRCTLLHIYICIHDVYIHMNNYIHIYIYTYTYECNCIYNCSPVYIYIHMYVYMYIMCIYRASADSAKIHSLSQNYRQVRIKYRTRNGMAKAGERCLARIFRVISW